MENLIDVVKLNLRTASEEIENAASHCGRNFEEISIMAVTKTHPAEYIQAALSCGIRHIGENRVSEGGRKIREIGRENAVFHAIGVLHRKEVRQAVRDFHWIDAVDRIEIANEIASRDAGTEILFEVNTSGETAKKGFAPDAAVLADASGAAIELGLRLQGFLTVGPLTGDVKKRRAAFELLRKLRDSVSGSLNHELPVLSMGMSDDFTEAVQEGSTIVRLGRRLFGERNR